MTEKPSNIPRAQAALDIFDLQGQDQAFRFALMNLSAHRPAAPDDVRILVLADNSVIQLAPGTATFAWRNSNETVTHHRLTTYAMVDQLPVPPAPPLHLCHWPNEQDLYEQFATAVQVEAQTRLGFPAEHLNPFQPHLTHLLAPDLTACAKDVISSSEIPDHLYSLLDQQLQNCVDRLMAQLPEDQFEALVKQATTTLEQ